MGRCYLGGHIARETYTWTLLKFNTEKPQQKYALERSVIGSHSSSSLFYQNVKNRGIAIRLYTDDKSR